MRVAIVCPAPAGSRVGNRITAERWRRMVRELGHAASLSTELPDGPFDVLVALHAGKAAGAVARCRERWPERAVVVALTGTDLHKDVPRGDAQALRSLDLADRLILLYPGAERALPPQHRDKAFLIVQSSPRIRRVRRPGARTFDVAVVGHLRPEKDPFRTALAARLLPASSRVRVLQAGRALSPEAAAQAREEAARNPRYKWLGELSPGRARALIGRSHALCLTSEMEGGANVLSESAAAGTPILASRIACTEGLLGSDYPGLFSVGDERALSAALLRAERDHAFLADLERRALALGETLSPAAEKAAWAALLGAIPATTHR